MSVIPTESNISMTGAGLVGKSTSGAGKSGRMSQASVLSWLGLSASGVTDGKALIASSNSHAWSPAAAALLPDTLPAVGTLLSYGGSRQLAAGGNVSHTGNITLTGGASGIYISPSGVNKGLVYFSSGQNRLYGQPAVPWVVESDAGFKVRNSANSADSAITAGAATFSGALRLPVGTWHVDSTGYNRIYYTFAGNTIFASGNSAGELFAFRGISGGDVVSITAGGNITAQGAVMETPTQSTINPTTVNIPTGKRRGWYNSTLAEFRDWVNIGGTLLKSAAYT